MRYGLICRGPPFGFDAKLSEAYPDLYQKLKEVKDSGTCKLHCFTAIPQCWLELFPLHVGALCNRFIPLDGLCLDCYTCD